MFISSSEKLGVFALNYTKDKQEWWGNSLTLSTDKLIIDLRGHKKQ